MGSQITGSKITGVKLLRVKLRGVKLPGIKLPESNYRSQITGVKLPGVKLPRALRDMLRHRKCLSERTRTRIQLTCTNFSVSDRPIEIPLIMIKKFEGFKENLWVAIFLHDIINILAIFIINGISFERTSLATWGLEPASQVLVNSLGIH